MEFEVSYGFQKLDFISNFLAAVYKQVLLREATSTALKRLIPAVVVGERTKCTATHFGIADSEEKVLRICLGAMYERTTERL